VNSVIRQKNNAEIKAVCQKTAPERLWDGRFLRMERGSPEAGFADHRTYLYQGQEIDRQVHLGIDLASTQHSEVVAANRGRVAFAGYLGLYGNAVIIDHGQGVFSLYGHLSEITVTLDAMLDKGAIIGRTGSTGMAGGDHLHFSMLVNGTFVTPVEWWDAHWLQDNIFRFL
jgi:murein DD-endopeptidase MepM/ murein hydrolase activator NlpD